MNQTNLLQKISSLGIAILSAVSTVGLTSKTSQAANIFFLQPGAQLDNDTILDIKIGPNQPLVFNIYADITGYTPSDPRTAGIVLNYDVVTDEYFGALNPNEFRGVDLSGPTVQQIGQFAGVTLNPGIEPHDGIVDFGITLTGVDLFDINQNLIGTESADAFDAPSFNAMGESGTEFNQVVELQKAFEPSSVLGLIVLGGLGLGLKYKKE